MKSRHLSLVIGASPEAVYEFAADPANLPRWAAGLAEAQIETQGDVLVVQSPMGQVMVRFVPRNPFGVLDHDVTLPSGVTINNPLRVMAHPQGAEVVFTLRQHALNEEEFNRDSHMVEQDLQRLRGLVESPGHPRRPPSSMGQ